MGDEVFGLLSIEQLQAAIGADDAAIAAAQEHRLALVRELDRRTGAIPGIRPGTEAVVVLRSMRAEAPEEDVRLARTLGQLPALAQAFAAGEANRAHVKIAERTIRKIGDITPDTLTRVDTTLTNAARDTTPQQFKHCGERILAYLADNAGDTLDNRPLDRRYLIITPRIDGWATVKGLLPRDTAARLTGMIDHRAKPRPLTHTGDDETLPIRDERSQPQRQADALDLWLREAGSTGSAPELPHMMIHIKTDLPVADCDQTGPLSKAWVGRMLCESVTEILYKDRDDNPLKLGRTARFPTPPQRRALVARDRTCVIPGCTIPARWCDAHHCLWWNRDHGPTDTSNMVMLCGPHHTAVHAKTWTLEMRNGTCWAKPPAWLDPQQRWQRNTLKDHLDAAEQLAIDLNPPEAA